MDSLKKIIEEHGIAVTVEKGATLTRQGHPVDWFIILLDGEVKIEQNALNGKNILLCFYRAGADLPKKRSLTVEQGDRFYVGEMELFSDDTRANSTVTAITEIRAVKIPQAVMRAEAERNAELACSLAASLAHKMDSHSRMSAINLLYALKQRYAYHLLGLPAGKPVPIALEESAGVLGTSVRHLQRALAELERAGCLVREGRTLRITNRKLLRHEADSIADE